MPSRKMERRIDDALLATAAWAGFTYARRIKRRFFSRVAKGAAAIGAIAALATVLVTVGLAWRRSRTKVQSQGPSSA